MPNSDDLDVRTAQARFENEVGPRQTFGAYARCPKCRNLGVQRQYCKGSSVLTTRVQGQIPCPLEGTHLHVHCPCNWQGIERTADDPENGTPSDDYEMPEAPEILLALTQMNGGQVTIPADALATAQASDGTGIRVLHFPFGVRLVVKPAALPSGSSSEN